MTESVGDGISDQPTTWLKYKYRCPKIAGRFHGGHNDSGVKRHKVRQDPNPPPGERVLVISPTGKRRFIWR